MTWLKVSDDFHAHPKVLIAGNEAVGLWVRCAAWASSHLTDGFVPTSVVQMYGGAKARKLADQLVNARPPGHTHGLLEVVEGGYAVHDFLKDNPSRDEVEGERARRAELRDADITAAVRLRDGNHCRYCGRVVKWKDRRGDAGGTYDHVEPGIADGERNLVVCCRGCNAQKGRRSPADAGMTLLPARTGCSASCECGDPIQVGPRSDLGRIKPQPGSDPEKQGDAPGTGRVGSGPGRETGSEQRAGSGSSPGRAGAGSGIPPRPFAPRVDASRCPTHRTEEPCRQCAQERHLAAVNP